MNTPNQLLDIAIQYHDALPKRIREYLRGRGISDAVIDSNLLGWNGWRITIPIYNRQGEVVLFKLAKDPEDKRPSAKMLTSRGGGVELYGWDEVLKQPQGIIICEGEFDRLVLQSYGFAAVTSTGGAATFRQEWAQAIQSIPQVYACFDRDQAGRNGAMMVSLMIPHARVVELPEEVGERGDVTDYFVRLKRSPDEFAHLLSQAKPAQSVPNKSHLLHTPPMQSTSLRFTNQAERIKRDVSIIEIIEQYVDIRPSGQNFTGCCPFHDDRIPSLMVYLQTQKFHCFGCRAHGDVIAFIQKIEQVTFPQALEILSQLTPHNEAKQQRAKQNREAA